MNHKGENPKLIRDRNLKLVLNTLRKKSQSVTDLAKELDLSNTAVTKIINELITLNMVIEADKVKSKVPGRRRVNFKYNPSFGHIAVLNFALKEIIICDMLGVIVEKKKLTDVSVINKEYINKSIEILKDMKYSLLSICIVTIGKIDPQTHQFIYALNIEGYKNINLFEMFSQAFDSQILVKNDIALGLIGEQKRGALTSNYQNGLYVYMGESIASSLILNGKLYEGSRGFAGEIGLFSSSNYNHLEDVITKNNFDEIIKELSIVLKNITELLDLEIIVLSGEAINDEFLNKIVKFIRQYEYLNVCIVKSHLQENAITIGAIESAIVNGINTILNNRKE